MPTYTEHNLKDARLRVLQELAIMPGFYANEDVLLLSLRRAGHRGGKRSLRGILDWLHEHHLIREEILKRELPDDERDEMRATLRVCELTEFGLDVASGDETCAGVAEPRPRLR